MKLAKSVFNRMGFQLLPVGESIAGVFHSFHVYEVQGFVVNAGALDLCDGCVDGTPYKLCVGSSVIETCRKLGGDKITGDEDEWQKDTKSTPPYLVIRFGPTKEHQIGSTKQHQDTEIYFKNHEEMLVTYDSFAEAKKEIKAQEDFVLPPLLSALACSFASIGYSIRFLHIFQAFAGITKDGKTIQDYLIRGSGFVYTSKYLGENEVQQRLADAVGLASEINPQVAKFCYLALNEDDHTLKFLYFFLAIEKGIKHTFDRLKYEGRLSKPAIPPKRALASYQILFARKSNNRNGDNKTTLKDRFIWCVILAWAHLSDADVNELDRLKDIRNNIAHGEISKPPHEEVIAVEKLITKIQLPRP